MSYDRNKTSKSQSRTELTGVDKGIRNLYTGEIGVTAFIEEYWSDSWDSLIEYIQQSGRNMRNGKVPQPFLKLKETFEQKLMIYYLDKPISMEIGDKYFAKIDRDDVETCLKYLEETEQFSSKSMRETIRKYLSGEIPEISRKPTSRGIPKADKNKITDKDAWRKETVIRSNVNKFYSGKMKAEAFVKIYAGTWGELLDTIEVYRISKPEEPISEEFLQRKEEFEVAIIKYFETDYCKMTRIFVDGQYVQPTTDDVHIAIKILKQNGMEIGKRTIVQTLTQYLRGEVELQADSIDLNSMREQRSKCQILETKLQQMQGELDSKNVRLQEMRNLLGQTSLEMAKVQEIAEEILEIAQEIEKDQATIDGVNVEKIAGEKQLKDMKAAAIAEIESI